MCLGKSPPAELTIADATVAAKTYDGKKDATVNSVSFTGFVNNETLTMGSVSLFTKPVTTRTSLSP